MGEERRVHCVNFVEYYMFVAIHFEQLSGLYDALSCLDVLANVSVIGLTVEVCGVTFNAVLQIIIIMRDVSWLKLIVTRWELI